MITKLLGIVDITAGALIFSIPSWGIFEIMKILLALILFIKGIPSLFGD